MIGNIPSIGMTGSVMKMVQKHPQAFTARGMQRNLAIKKKKDDERAERKRKILALRNQ